MKREDKTRQDVDDVDDNDDDGLTSVLFGISLTFAPLGPPCPTIVLACLLRIEQDEAEL